MLGTNQAWTMPAASTAGIVHAWFVPSIEPLRLELHSATDGSVLAVHDLDPFTSTPIVRSQTVVRRGDRLAVVGRQQTFTPLPSLVALRALLDVCSTTDWPATVAPCRATVEAIEPDAITLRAPDGRSLRLRCPRRHHVAVRIGDIVRAGEPLVDGERNHHALLHAWGEDRLADHLLDELGNLLGHAVPPVYWALVVRAMLDQRATRERNGRLAVTAPALRGLRSIAAQRRR